MKKLSDYKGLKIAVNCTTPEQAEAFCKLMHENGLTWFTGTSYLKKTFWDSKDTCYLFNKNTHGKKDWLIQNGYTILPATDFLEEEFVYGQEYEFSNFKNFADSRINFFGCKIPYKKEFKIVSFNKDGEIIYFKYCRKINTERNEAITKAKELITKFDIKQEELY